MSPDARTPFYRTPAELQQLLADLRRPGAFAQFLHAIRERRARLASPNTALPNQSKNP